MLQHHVAASSSVAEHDGLFPARPAGGRTYPRLRLSFVGDRNSAEEIRRGHIVIGFKAEEPPVRRITTESARFRKAIAIMVSNLERQLGIAA
jgi:hypothetical protein